MCLIKLTTICYVTKCGFLGGARTNKKKHVCAFMSQKEDDYRGYLVLNERFSVTPIHHADTYLSKKIKK